MLLSKIRADEGIALAVATSGIAAILLRGGTTVHSRFRVPLTDKEGLTLGIQNLSTDPMAQKDCDLLIWDEVVIFQKRF